MDRKPDMQPSGTAMKQIAPAAQAIGEEQLKQFTDILQRYHAGLSRTKQRIVQAENWWKLRNATEEQAQTEIGKDGGFVSRSGWLHNVLVSKHADAMESYPEPNILPREAGDRGEALMLSSIVPCVLEQCGFEQTYSDAMWDKGKFGTGVYKVVWDSGKYGGLGDVAIECVSLLNLYWEPGVTDIQQSRYFFHTELCDKDLLRARYPDLLTGKLRAEIAGILNWAVEGYRLYASEGLKMPGAVAKAVAEYRHEMDSISQFLEECTEPGGEVPANVLYAAYKDWARDGEQYVHSSTKFGMEMAKLYQKIKGKYGAKYFGLHLVNNHDIR